MGWLSDSVNYYGFGFCVMYACCCCLALIKLCSSMSYEPKKKCLNERGTCDPSKVTVIVKVTQKAGGNFSALVKNILRNGPMKVIVAHDSPMSKYKRKKCGEYPNVDIVEGKLGSLKISTEFVAIVEDTVELPENFLEVLIAPFQHNPEIEATTIDRAVTVDDYFDFHGVFGNMIYEQQRVLQKIGDKAYLPMKKVSCFRSKLLLSMSDFDWERPKRYLRIECQVGSPYIEESYLWKEKDALASETMWDTYHGVGFDIDMLCNNWRVDRNISEMTVYRIIATCFKFLMMSGAIGDIIFGSSHQFIPMIIFISVATVLEICPYLLKNPKYIYYVPMFIICQHALEAMRLYGFISYLSDKIVPVPVPRKDQPAAVVVASDTEKKDDLQFDRPRIKIN
ncbi:MAG: hypothetical protein Hyperionvirus12_41 [Hyperionvirus sp.]|uniref:Uncharacterized protein n=1 Tax=Hyperionvirus sp. TaxID=2487770 RepID=A0A3G5AB61_9VIRU|nr:MAG: hypothetical protein Hyperionvirus12_41 [Hyperionvirus sp.]